MSQPAHFQQVIQRVIERNAAKALAPADLAEAIVEGLDLAEAILGDAPAAPVKRLEPRIFLTRERIYPEVDTSGAVLIGEPKLAIGEEAPPAAIVRNPAGVSLQDTFAEADEKKSKLHSAVLEKLPASLTLDLPEVGKITLLRFVLAGPQGTDFIKILFAQDISQEDGPSVILLAGRTFDPAIVMADIAVAAHMRYRAKKPKIDPKLPKLEGIPDVDNLTLRPTATDLAPTSSEDLSEWRRLTGSSRV